jgi:chromosomal replication initiator protein
MAVAVYYRLDVAELKSAERVRRIARPRQMAMYLCRDLTRSSYPEIARAFDKASHKTVWYAVRHIAALADVDPEVAGDLASVRRLIAEIA